MTARIALAGALLLAACAKGDDATPADRRTRDGFPVAERTIAPTVSSQWSTENARDQRREATAVMAAAGIRAGMTVADLGAGEGYYTIRLAARVGKDGRVLAEDIVPAYHDALADRVYRDRLDNVSVKLGKPADPGLPPGSFDRVFMVHMYHEIAAPYEFLWNLRPALAPGGQVVVVDAERPSAAHGMPPAQLDCEFEAVGYARVKRIRMPQAGGYLTLYRAEGPRPAPHAIRGCKPVA